jgi:hypothetical protein
MGELKDVRRASCMTTARSPKEISELAAGDAADAIDAELRGRE